MDEKQKDLVKSNIYEHWMIDDVVEDKFITYEWGKDDCKMSRLNAYIGDKNDPWGKRNISSWLISICDDQVKVYKKQKVGQKPDMEFALEA